MESFFVRQYRIIFGTLLGAIAGLSFYVGMLEGKQLKGDSVTLSCSDDVLSQLAIPLEGLASGQNGALPVNSATTAALPAKGAFAGSKNGTKYYAPGCAGLKRIKPENIIWFQSAEDATLQGYTPASC